MIRTYSNLDNRFVRDGEDLARSGEAVWIDLLQPTRDEETAVERVFGIDVPTREEMHEIELSSRLYMESGAHFMTANMLSHTDGDDVVISPITFILQDARLITVRYAAPRIIEAFVSRCERNGAQSADGLMAGLIEGMVERLADLLERAGHDLEMLSARVFSPAAQGAGGSDPQHRRPRNYGAVLEQIGRKADLMSKVRDSLVSLERLLTYVAALELSRKPGADVAGRVMTATRDVQALNEQSTFLNQKVTFLLDATLGMINIEQTAIIKLFSVAAVVFLPPTLIASVYGMNFDVMPELRAGYGYPLSLLAMIASAVLPYQLFKRWGWL